VEQFRQRPHPAPNTFFRQDGQVVRLDQEKDQLTFPDLQAVFGELVNAHELPGRMQLFPRFFLFSSH